MRHPIDREFALLRASYADEELRCQLYCEVYPNTPTHPRVYDFFGPRGTNDDLPTSVRPEAPAPGFFWIDNIPLKGL
jgi:hypothetical protein